MSTHRTLLSSFSMLVIITMLFSGSSLPAASAQGPDEIERQLNPQTGKLSFINPPDGQQSLPAADVLGDSRPPQDPAMALANRYGPEFGLKDPGRDLQEFASDRAEDGRLTVRYQQNYQGIPVIGGELIVNTNDNGDLYSLNGEVSSNLSLSTQPTIGAETARETALLAVAKWYQKSVQDFLASEPELWIYDESLLQPSKRPAELVWRMEVTPKDASMPVRELVLVNAQQGGISLHFNQVDTAWQERIQRDQPQQTLPLAASSTVKYEDLVVDEARNRLYGADKAGNKVDVISMTDLSVISSYSLVYGAAPVSLDLSPNGNELAVAQSGSGQVAFINLTNGTISELAGPLGSSSTATDVIYGRTGVLYALSGNGIHVINLTATPHEELTTQYVAEGSYEERFGGLSSDKNTLYFVTGTCCSGYNRLNKYDVSTGLAKPVLRQQTHLYGTGYLRGIRLHLIDDASVLLTTGSVYNTSNLTPRAKNFQKLLPAINLPGRNFYATVYNNAGTLSDDLHFYDNETSHRLSSLSIGVIGTPGAIATTDNGNTIFVSSTGGMTKFSVGDIPPGTPAALPASQGQYNDLAIDLPRNLAYGTDVSGNIDVIDLDTGNILNSYLLPSGADPMGIDLSPDGTELAIALHGLEKILFINPENGTSVAEVTPQLNNDIYYTNLPFDLIYGKTGRLYSSGNPSSSGIDYIHVTDTSNHTWVTKSPYPNVIRTSTEFILNQSKTYLYANQTFSPNNLYIYDVQTDLVTELYKGPHGPVYAPRFTIVPDGSKIFTSSGQVWDNILQSQLGSLQGAPGKLIKYIPNQNLIVLSATSSNGDILKFISPTDYRLLGTHIPSPAGTIHEMEVTPDGSRLVFNIGNEIRILYLDLSAVTSFSALGGSNQSAPLQTEFLQPLQVKVKNYLDLPVAGVTVTFTAPSSGSSAVFEDTGTNTTTAVTDSNGIATVTLSANDVTGMYTVTASVDGLASSVDFQLTNVDATIPSSISIVSGSNQSAALQTQFLQLLKVKIRNGLNQPLSGKTVTFTAPATGASGTFANSHTGISTAVTDANGIATASAFTANNARGSYVVVATVAGLETSANFQLFNGTPIVKTYTANNGISLPGTFLCDQTKPNCTNNVNPHADAAHRYAMGTNTLYANQHGRDSIDNRGMAIISTVHFYSGYANAFWTGAQMVYGDAYGFPLADDVVAHELTHGVTQYESNLFYYYQSGAINESFSDLWGEYYDQTNGKGNDDASVKWLMGEDVSGWGAIRSMSDPTWFGDPDKMSSGYYYEDDGDNGGVHSNSGINNKAAYLMVDGGSFNGKTVTALGWTKTAAIYYEANSKLLSSGADYSDLYYALQKACSNLVGQKGMTTANCVEVKDAVDAVEMNGQPAPNFNTDAPLCAAGTVLNVVFADDLENGTGKWAFANGAYPRWQLDSLYGPYAQSGNHSLYADDSPDTITDATARLTPLTIPPNAFLNFAHAYGFETGYYSGILQNFDGGVLEYSINGGATWVDAGSLINFNGYKGAIFTGAGNPLSGRSAFVGSSHGYIGTRLNLASLAGKSVSFRWRMGLDEAASNWGWWVDNIKVYTCIPVPGAFNKTTPSNGGTNVALSTTLSWNSSPYATSYQYCYDVIDDNKCNRTWGTIANTSAPISSLGANTTYFWQVRASNQVATTEADNQSWGSFTTTSTLPAGTADLETSIRGTLQGKYSLGSGLSLRESYTGVNNGPVMMRSANGIPMIAAERMIYKANGVDTSFSEMMGMPASQLDTTYWLPWYNNKDLNTQLRIANVSDTDAVIHVSIGGTPVDGSPYTLTPGASKRLSFPGIDRGPVKIESNVNIVAAERVIYKVNGLNTSYSEMMALPNKQLDTTYWLPWYNSKNLNTQLRIANVSDTDATVNVSIGGTPVDGSPFLIPVGASKRLSFPGIDKGPVKIESDVNIVAAERVIYRVNGVDTSFSEMMAVPAGQLDTFYWLPWYNNKSASIDTQLRFANVSDQPATVYVTIGGIEVADSPFTLTPGASTRRSFAGIDKGPVKIESDVPIVVAERVIYKAPGNIPTSFSEMTGLPDHLLDTAYWLPWYNNVELNTQLRFGVP